MIHYAIEMARGLVARLHKGERGQDLIEYALLGGLIAVAIIVGGVLFDEAIAGMIGGIADCIDFDGGTGCAVGLPEGA